MNREGIQTFTDNKKTVVKVITENWNSLLRDLDYECIMRIRKCYPDIKCWGSVTAKGVAKCAPEDEFDFEVGSRLAFKKAKNKLCKIRLKIYDIIQEYYYRKHAYYWSKYLKTTKVFNRHI